EATAGRLARKRHEEREQRDQDEDRQEELDDRFQRRHTRLLLHHRLHVVLRGVVDQVAGGGVRRRGCRPQLLPGNGVDLDALVLILQDRRVDASVVDQRLNVRERRLVALRGRLQNREADEEQDDQDDREEPEHREKQMLVERLGDGQRAVLQRLADTPGRLARLPLRRVRLGSRQQLGLGVVLRRRLYVF